MDYKEKLIEILHIENNEEYINIINSLENETAEKLYNEIKKYYDKSVLATPIISIVELRDNKVTVSYKLKIVNYVTGSIYK